MQVRCLIRLNAAVRTLCAFGLTAVTGSIACSDADDTDKSSAPIGLGVPPLVFPSAPAGSAPTGGASTGGAGLTGGMSTGGSTEIDADPAPGDEESVYCGDWARDPDTEECDPGPEGPFVACTVNCQVRDFLVVSAPETAPSPEDLAARVLGDSPHSLAASERHLGVAFFDPDTSNVSVALLDERGAPGAVVSVGAGTSFADPALAGLGNAFYAAWNDLNGDGQELGVALRRIDAKTHEMGAATFANTTAVGAQYAPDIIADGSAVVVAWTDTSDAANGPDIRWRRFDANLTPLGDEETLAASPLPEGSVSLAARNGVVAAAWRENRADGKDVVVVSIDDEVWRLTAVQPGGTEDRPSLAFLDATHVFVAYTTNTDPENTGVYNVPRLRGAIVEMGQSTPVELASIAPLQADYEGTSVEKLAIGQYRPRVTSAGGVAYLAWQSKDLPADIRREDLWLKPLYWNSATETLSVDVVEQSLPRTAMHRLGDQRDLSIVGTPLSPDGALLMAWTDYGETVDPWQGHPDVVAQLAPVPMRRGAEVPEECDGLCEAGEGPCESTSDCVADTECVAGRGPWYGYGPSTAVCVPTHCNDQLVNNGETGLNCGTADCGPCFDCHRDGGVPQPAYLGTSTFCSAVCPCDKMEGDCDSNYDCEPGLECTHDVGGQRAPPFPDEIDLCVHPQCLGPAGLILCGGDNCLPCPAGDPNYCVLQTCTEGQGDCDSNEQCAEGLYCEEGTGALSCLDGSVGICRSNACAPPVPPAVAIPPNSPLYCGIDCRCGIGTGECTDDGQCLSGLTCKPRGLSYGKPTEFRVCSPSSCSDGDLDAGETSIDCGGTCGVCSSCALNETFMSFESSSNWNWAPGYVVPAATVTKTQTTTKTHGSSAQRINACGFVDIVSKVHSTADIGIVGNELWLDFFVPAVVPNSNYVGTLSLSVSVPGANIPETRLEAITPSGPKSAHPLTGLTRGGWTKLTFAIPQSIQDAYHQDSENAQFRIRLSTPACAAGTEPGFILDYLRFGGSQASFRSVCNGPNDNAGSLEQNFSFEQLAVWKDAFGNPSALTAEATQVSHLLQAAKVPHNTTVTIQSGAFSTLDVGVAQRLKLDVLVPSGSALSGTITASGMCPGIGSVSFGSKQLSGLPLNQYSTLALTVPPEGQAALDGNFSGCRVTLAITTSGLTSQLRIDNLRFGAASQCEDYTQTTAEPFLALPIPPDGTSSNPYPLCSAAQVQTVIDKPLLWSKVFHVRRDIDLTGVTGSIGTGATPFTGVFNGGGFELSNYSRVAATTPDVGLFGVVSSSIPGTNGIVGNARLRSFDVTGQSNVGTLVGRATSGAILHDINVIEGSVKGNTYVGGLVGWMAGNNLAACTSSAAVLGTGSADRIGGLIGDCAGTSLIRDSSGSGLVTAVTGNRVGGLVGSCGAYILDSYATGDVTAVDNVGGLIGYAEAGAHVTGCNSLSAVTGATAVGGLIGTSSASVTNSLATGDVAGTSSCGGLVGYELGGTLLSVKVTDSFATGNVKGTNLGMVGGLIGRSAYTRVDRGFAKGSVTAPGASSAVGGLIGAASTTRVSDSFSTGAVTASSNHAGGLLGDFTATSALKNSYTRSALTTPGGGLIGYGDASTGTASAYDATVSPGLSVIASNGPSPISTSSLLTVTTSMLQQQSNFVAYGWDFSTTWKMGVSGFPELSTVGFCQTYTQQVQAPFQTNLPAPNGTAANPYRICTPAQLQTVIDTPALWSKYFLLEADLDMSSVAGSIGNTTTAFTGTFDGRNHRFFNYVASGTTDVGLFGRVVGDGAVNGVADGRIANVGMHFAYVTGTTNVGALVGSITSGIVEDVTSFNGSVVATATGSGYIGGLVGNANNSTIRNCMSHVGVVGNAAQRIGGLVGSLEGTGAIENGVAMGVVTATAGAAFVGGLVGRVTNVTGATSTAQVNVTGAVNYVGGLAGRSVAGSTLTNLTASGAVTAPGSTSVGGLIGWNEGSVSLSQATNTVTGLTNVGGAFGVIRGSATRTTSTGTVTGGGTKVGGFVGHIDNAIGSGSASRCSAHGAVSNNVTGATGYVGGFAGYAGAATLADNYASGNVTALSTAPSSGGFAGRLELGSLVRSYSRGSITGGAAASKGAFIGTLAGATAPTLTSLFYSTATTSGLTDIGTSIAAVGTNPTTITGVTDTALKTQSTFTGWDFTNIWIISAGQYPALR